MKKNLLDKSSYLNIYTQITQEQNIIKDREQIYIYIHSHTLQQI